MKGGGIHHALPTSQGGWEGQVRGTLKVLPTPPGTMHT